MKLGWLWVPIVGVVGMAIVEGPLTVLAALAIVLGGIVAAMAAQDKIGARDRKSKPGRRER